MLLTKFLCFFLALPALQASETNEEPATSQPKESARKLQQCVPGADNCEICNIDGTACISCMIGSDFSSTGACVWSECDPTFYFNPVYEMCIPCSSTFTLCDKCTKNGCTGCTYGYYLDQNTQQCSRCNEGCGDCTSFNQCVKCMDPFNIPYSDGSCSSNGHGTFIDPITGHTEFCDWGCKTCDASSCTACWAWDATISGTNCYCFNYNSPYSIGTASYQSCHNVQPTKGCAEWGGRHNLNGWGEYKCFSCQVGYYREGHQCFPCALGCFACSDRNTCTWCIDEAHSTVSGNQCICNDNHSYFNTTANRCHFCPDQCTSCSSYDNCNGCLGNSNFYYETGKCSCQNRQYWDITNQMCQSCGSGCDFCEFSSNCIRCMPGYYLYGNSGSMACRGCSNQCSNCGNNDDCYQCGTSVELKNNQCTEDTNLGYKIRYQDTGLLILDFPYDLPYYLSLKEVIIKSQGFYDTSSWYMDRLSQRQYRVYTSLTRSNLPIDIRFKFNRN